MPDYFVPLTAREGKIIYMALRCYDGESLRPDWSRDEQEELTSALDALRAALYDGVVI